MNVLLDTHTFLWFSNGDSHLSQNARQLIEDPTVTKYVSIASLWEIAIKVSAGKLNIGLPITEVATLYIENNALILLPILPYHLDRVATLPFHHRDPFDRLLIAQALTDHCTIITRDDTLNAYDAKTIW